ncbi:MAG: hypothetical protein A2231_05480 [Candidatus Firestonebacteria bacterium RIFOXYA2_FULL_40_8]|nr:MAG: hypothetical protein A2231_05480 [Candidatus Firestonebacteria bacterium RIFOXYA2_FULL_40_8]
MRKILAAAAAVAAVIFTGSVLCAADEGDKSLKKGDKMELIKFDKGEIIANGASGDNSKSFTSSLSKEHAAKGKMYCGKVVMLKDGESCSIITHDGALLKGKRGNWKDYDSFVIKYYLDGDKPLAASAIIADQESFGQNWENWKYSSYVSRNLVFQPGENTLSIDLSSLVSNGGRTLDLGNMRTFGIGKPKGEEFTIYFQELYVEKE